MHAHLEDLRSAVRDDDGGVPEWVERLVEGWREAGLGDTDAALAAFAEKLTRTPAAMLEQDVAELRTHGLSDEAIHEAIQVIAYFNYINRVADATHVDLEPEMPPYPEA